jgi:hypothetical protein
MKAKIYGIVVRLQTENTLEDTAFKALQPHLPRSIGVLPDNSLGIDLMPAEVWQLIDNTDKLPIGREFKEELLSAVYAVFDEIAARNEIK